MTPFLYAADGTEYQLSPITLAPAGVVSVDIRGALGAAPEEIKAHFSDYGSAAVKYVWHWSGAATAMVDNRDAKRSLNFGFELRAPMPSMRGIAMKHGPSATVQEGLWWREDTGVNGFLALVNVAPRPVSVQVEVLSDYGALESERTIHLQTNETRNLDLLGDTKDSSGGIRVAYEGAEKDVMVAGGLENPQEGYSAQIPFVAASSPSKPANIAFSSVGLMLGAPDPMMKFPAGTQFGIYLALRNTTSRPILVTPTLYYMDGPNPRKSDLNTLALAAGQAKHWTPQELATQLGLPKLSGMVNLVFSYQGVRNDVIIANGSIDQTKTYVFEIKIEGVSKSLGKGLKDWDVSNGNDTMISILNPDEKDEDLSITFYFDGGHYKLPVHLNAGGSAMFNLSDIIMMQQPDSDGNKIPPGTLHGTAVLSAASADPQWINVGVSVGIFNVSTATCGGHCPYCTDFIDFLVVADIGTAPVGQDTEFSSWAESSDNTWIDYTLQSQWTSSNIQVAQPSGVGSFTGVSPGSFTATASATLEGGTADCPEDCSPSYFQDGAPGDVIQVQVTRVDLAGDEIDVSLQGASGTSGTLVVTWNGPSGNSDIVNTSKAVGSYTFNPALGTLVAGQYTGVTAQWLGANATFSNNFDVLGTYLHTQYNSPAESQCSGGSATAYLTSGPSACAWNSVSLVQQFITQAWINGSGITNNYGPCQEYLAGCSPPTGGNQNYFREVGTITPGCGSPNNFLSATSVAVDVFSSNHPLKCGDQVLIVGLGTGVGTVKTATDSCPACNGAAHIDDYNTSNACSLGTLGNFQTIRINR